MEGDLERWSSGCPGKERNKDLVCELEQVRLQGAAIEQGGGFSTLW